MNEVMKNDSNQMETRIVFAPTLLAGVIRHLYFPEAKSPLRDGRRTADVRTDRVRGNRRGAYRSSRENDRRAES